VEYQTPRFRFSRARTRFDCFDCGGQITITMQFAFDNLRNVKICEPCFYKLSPSVQPSESPRTNESRTEATSIPLSPENCPQCKQEAVQRKLKTEFDTVDYWRKEITESTNAEFCQQVWKECDSIAWALDERAELGFAYMAHLANLISLEKWGKGYVISRKELKRMSGLSTIPF
jgi:hypothetical protein